MPLIIFSYQILGNHMPMMAPKTPSIIIKLISMTILAEASFLGPDV